MKYNPKIHHRRSIRLKGYDYSQSGLYFITICCQHKTHLFGCIEDNKMLLNDAGIMVEYWYYELQNKFKNIECRDMVIMPNHFHCIIEIIDSPTVGTDLCVCPVNIKCVCPDAITDERVCPDVTEGTHAGVPLCASNKIPISTVVQWFKTMTTNHYIRGVRRI